MVMLLERRAHGATQNLPISGLDGIGMPTAALARVAWTFAAPAFAGGLMLAVAPSIAVGVPGGDALIGEEVVLDELLGEVLVGRGGIDGEARRRR